MHHQLLMLEIKQQYKTVSFFIKKILAIFILGLNTCLAQSASNIQVDYLGKGLIRIDFDSIYAKVDSSILWIKYNDNDYVQDIQAKPLYFNGKGRILFESTSEAKRVKLLTYQNENVNVSFEVNIDTLNQNFGSFMVIEKNDTINYGWYVTENKNIKSRYYVKENNSKKNEFQKATILPDLDLLKLSNWSKWFTTITNEYKGSEKDQINFIVANHYMAIHIDQLMKNENLSSETKESIINALLEAKAPFRDFIFGLKCD